MLQHLNPSISKRKAQLGCTPTVLCDVWKNQHADVALVPFLFRSHSLTLSGCMLELSTTVELYSHKMNLWKLPADSLPERERNEGYNLLQSHG